MRLRSLNIYWRTLISRMIQVKILWRPYVLSLPNLLTQMTLPHKQKTKSQQNTSEPKEQQNVYCSKRLETVKTYF